MHLNFVSDIWINFSLLQKYNFLLYFQIGKDDDASLSNCKDRQSYLLIRDVVRHIPGKEITDTKA